MSVIFGLLYFQYVSIMEVMGKLWDERYRCWRDPLRPSDTEFVTRGPQKKPIAFLARQGRNEGHCGHEFSRGSQGANTSKGAPFSTKKNIEEDWLHSESPDFFFHETYEVEIESYPQNEGILGGSGILGFSTFFFCWRTWHFKRSTSP